ncbi:type I-C CRISPR-associated endonuclease Cas1c [Yersinia intermedia]|uniref:type I-C CRISPR-associated endonuclease Cas1c n=1 Tax=Yersinia intermedia TaxID=631 RepID=UPI000B7574AB|nr:type I-C CRISPR-associated endonuclease Cas1c [Yersinia intermedia]MCW8114127.1 type I-C CRISPR-associated endonuclease Cas1c [Yersinia intermedia]MDA5518896.1 type I-C CRISPR-associated endonuclease Cas1c [Yersinia intermedia]OWF86327.1 subtype I-C CRISPR-associated endonuclease Cas1 [Yersinia intermedia]
MKKLQNSLYINRDGAYLHKERETLLIEQTIDGQRQKLLQVPIHSVGNIFCFGNIMVSPQLMGFCGENGTQLSFFDRFGRFQARVVGKQTGNVLLRRAQFRCSESGDAVIARNIVAAKIQSSRIVLMRHLRTYGEQADIRAATHRMRQIVAELVVQTDIDRIRGLEGEAASHYFGVFDQLLTHRSGFVFDGRNRRPPRDPVNAMLSFLYSIMSKEISGALQGVGLDPQVGFLHVERPGRDSLALDLLEEFRAPIVDRLVLTLINRQQLKTSDFATDILGGVILKDDARKQVLQAWQTKKQEEITHPFLQEKIAIGLLPHVQAMLLARHLRGDLAVYPPYIYR